MKRLVVFFAVLGALMAQPARSDELRPGYLELRQTDPSTYSLLFKIPARGEDLRLAVYVNLPEGARISGRRAIARRRRLCRTPHHPPGWWAHRTCHRIEGLSATSTDVLVRIETLAGAIQTERLSPTRTAFVVQAAPGAGEIAATYLRLGVEHILFGFDHLLFVLALVILFGDGDVSPSP